jgi:hypothetical protein
MTFRQICFAQVVKHEQTFFSCETSYKEAVMGGVILFGELPPHLPARHDSEDNTVTSGKD